MKRRSILNCRESVSLVYMINGGNSQRKKPVNQISISQNPIATLVLQKKKWGLFILLFFTLNKLAAQNSELDKEDFFSGGGLIEIKMVADFKTLITKKLSNDFKNNYQNASITFIFPDSTKLTDTVQIRPRGKYRREECSMPPLMINFKTGKPGQLSKLGNLKLVWPCESNSYYEQLILKEYLVYKIFNLLTEKSFRVRLVKVGYHDINEKIKPNSFYAFLLEDVDEMAKRNNCKEIQSVRLNSWQTNREQMTMVSLFEYMIGNCDWTVPIYRNVKLMRNKTDSLSKPYVIPYDFDYSGLVNAKYAIPPPDLPIKYVQERYYLGFSRTIDELKQALQIFKNQQQAIDSLIMNLEPLALAHKKEMSKYLQDFFKLIEKEHDIKEQFINNARPY